ncbi:MAG: Flp pilus assembly protein CpaB [Bdellovibrionaceae bacterium]|nr:Flp pilus assembly protein CpaB [Pseudobdellovibrionaceae bacterium]
MNHNETRTLWISVIAALSAVFLIYSYTQEKSDALNKKFGAKEKVVVATRDINEMETINETMLDIVERPVDFIQPTAINDPELAVGMVALAPIKAEEQILGNKIMEPGPITGLSLQVSPGKRAVTIPIDEMRGIAKLIKPGDRVDVLAALDVGKGPSQRREVMTLMEDVVILATGVKVINELPRLFEKQGKDEFIKNMRADTTFTNVTVEANPKEAQDLIYILSTSPGSLFMTLRHPSDNRKNKLANTTIESVLRKVQTPMISQQLSRAPSSAAPPQKLPEKKKPKRKGPFIDL